MKTKYYFLAAIAGLTLASCSSDDFVGDLSPTTSQVTNETDAINFGFDLTKVTRGDIAGGAAADLLSNRFYVTGTKGKEKTDSPTDSLVFDNYLVMYTANTAGTTESNTANWEYVGLAPEITSTVTASTGSGTCKDSLKLSADNVTTQTIKYWDYTHLQYDFLAFSTGKYHAVAKTNPSDVAAEIGVTAMKHGQGLKGATAYTFYLPSIQALKNAYISDITEVARANFGKEVTLKFKNLGSKVRVALYETVPGYSVKAGSVEFYTVDGSTDFTGDKSTSAALISQDAKSFATSGQINVTFPNIGTANESNDNYNKASATVVDPVGTNTWKKFGTLASGKYAIAEGSEEAGSLYLGRTLPAATFAGNPNADYFETVFPVSSSYPLTLRVNYTLVATDGSGEEINVYGAKAVVPATYTVWKPNYAYTYIFKISDNTNGWTSPDAVQDGLFPITFDAVVAEFTDPSGEQTTVTTVATPSITTYQQGHTYATNEYSNTGEKLYVQVMDNNLSPAVLVGGTGSSLYKLNTQTSNSTDRSLLYLVSDDDATEAKVMDALEKRTTALDVDNVTGRNSITLTKQESGVGKTINNAVTSIVNGVDDNAITVGAGEAAEIAIANLTAGKTYAYVYDYTASTKATVDEYQPVAVKVGDPIESSTSTKSFYVVTVDDIKDIAITTAETTKDDDFIYFSKTTNGTGTPTYSYISVADKTTLPAGVIKLAKTSLTTTKAGTANAEANTFYFDHYITNNGLYAVKVIKITD